MYIIVKKYGKVKETPPPTQYERKSYKISDKALNIIKAAKDMSDRKGKVRLSDKLIDGMKDVGVKFEVPDWCPKHYKQGDFDNAV